MVSAFHYTPAILYSIRLPCLIAHLKPKITAGKYVPACAYTIHKMNNERQGGPVMNLKGISIGDGAFDPAHQLAGWVRVLSD